jgi:hypothetical protein
VQQHQIDLLEPELLDVLLDTVDGVLGFQAAVFRAAEPTRYFARHEELGAINPRCLDDRADDSLVVVIVCSVDPDQSSAFIGSQKRN